MRNHFKQWSEHGRVRLSLIGVAFVALLVGIVVPATTSTANHASSISGVFESDDGDLVNNHPDVAVDWNDFAGAGNATTRTVWKFHSVTDNTNDDIYVGGTKQDKNCPGINPTGSLGGGNSKFDLTRIYLAHQEIGGDDFLFIGWTRVDGSDTASSHVGYEFNTGQANCTNPVNGQKSRVADDVLIVYDFSGGDADAQFKVLRWITSGTCEVANSTPPCWGNKLTTTGKADGKVNAGTSVFDAIGNETLGPVQFGEGALNLTELGIDPCDLEGTVTGVARSSGDSGNAVMKDRVGPQPFSLDACVAENNITSLQTLNDIVTINGFNSLGAGTTPGTATVSLYPPSDPTCAGTPVYETVISPVTTGTINTLTDGDDPGGYTVPDTTSTVGLYKWEIVYTGDDKNAGATSLCGEESADVQYNF